MLLRIAVSLSSLVDVYTRWWRTLLIFCYVNLRLIKKVKNGIEGSAVDSKDDLEDFLGSALDPFDEEEQDNDNEQESGNHNEQEEQED